MLGRYTEALNHDERHAAILRAAPRTARRAARPGLGPVPAGPLRRRPRGPEPGPGAGALRVDTPLSLTVAYFLALCEIRSGHTETGTTVLLEVAERADRLMGPGSPLALMVATSRATAELRYGTPERAHEISESVLQGYQALLGDGHPYAIGARVNRALVLSGTGTPTTRGAS
ncbi:hypothetical protein NKH77_35445 [Streptomyces sp. M19]